MLTRRDLLRNSALIGAAAVMPASLIRAIENGRPITRTIPGTNETLPIVGLGSSASFSRLAGNGEIAALTDVLRTMIDNGGTVFDTAPSYGASEAVAGRIARDNNWTGKIFWATKVNVARFGGAADPGAARSQLQQSFDRLGKQPLDLIQVHNLADLATQMPIIEELKQDGKIRYIGTTSTRASRYADLEKAMRNYPLDFIGVDYAVDNRLSAERILPLAQDLGIAVLIYVPFGRTRLWRRVSGLEVPEWAREFDAHSWGQFFLKYAAAHPAATCVTPATSKPKHMLDNMGAAYGELPDAAMQKRMQEFVAALPGS